MNVLLVYNAHRHGGGSDAVAQRTGELLERAGHTVSVFMRSSQKLSGWRGSLQAFLCGLYSPSVLREFKRALSEVRPEVVHAHELYPLITPWIFRVCKKRSIPVVMTCHDYRISCPVATHFRQGQLCFECAGGHELGCIRHNCCGSRAKSIAYALRNVTARLFRLFSAVDRFLTPSEVAKSILGQQARLPADQIVIVGNPVLAVGDPQSAIRNPQSEHGYVAYAGRFEPEKGFPFLLEALSGTGIPLQVAGEPPAHIQSLGSVANGVQFLGRLNRNQMALFYQNARLLVVPSLWHETFGLVVAEALACGTPVVVTDLGALAEVAGSGGLVVPAGDVVALRAAILQLWNDQVLCQRMAAAGREHVKRYSDAAYLESLLNEYKRLAVGS